MTRHAASRSEVPSSEALQAYADDTKGERKLTAQFRKWRTRALIGGVAVALVGVAGVRSLFGGAEAADTSANNDVAGGNAPSSAPEASKSPEQAAFECTLDELRGTRQNADGSVALDVVLKTTGAASATYHAVPYRGANAIGAELPMVGNGGAGASLTTMAISKELFTADSAPSEEKKVIGVYAESTTGEIDGCGSYYIDSRDLNAHFEDPTGDDLPAYAR